MTTYNSQLIESQSAWIIIPAFNEQEVLEGVLRGLVSPALSVVVVDDGSTDKTSFIATNVGVTVLSHPTNRGQGAAIRTGIQYALRSGADVLVTFDADGQHSPRDIAKLLQCLWETNSDVVLGSRFLRVGDVNGLPSRRRRLLKVLVFLTKWATGLNISDAHNGLRAFTRHAAASINISHQGVGHATEILIQIASLNLRFKEVPVTVRYTDYSVRTGTRIRLVDAWEVVKMLVLFRFRRGKNSPNHLG